MSIWKKIVFAALVLAIIGIISLLWLVSSSQTNSFDIIFSQKFQTEGDFFFPLLMKFTSLFGQPVVAVSTVAFTAILFYLMAYRREAAGILFVPLADGLTELIKSFIGRPRPDASVVRIWATGSDSSFPSGHVVHYVVFFGFLFFTMLYVEKFPRLLRVIIALACLSLIGLVSLSRVYLGAHWLTDVVGGYLLGFVLLSLLLYFYLFKSPRRRAKLKLLFS